MLGRRVILVAFVAPWALSCAGDASSSGASVSPPMAVTAEPVATTSVRVSWTPPAGATIATFELQRRANLAGPFTTLVSNVPNTGSTIVYYDNTVQAETYYGYRVIALTTLGDRSPPSTAAGTKTPPQPGVQVTVTTQAPNELAQDADGYVLSLRGPRDTIAVPMPVRGDRRFSPLRAGQYRVVLRGLAAQCTPVNGDSVRTVTVVEEGVNTVATVRYDVTCRDPRRGSIIVGYAQDGDTTDADGVRLTVTGQYTDTDPADTSHVFLQRETFSNRTGNVRLDNLRKGAYELSIDDIDSPCAVTGARTQQLTVGALSVDSVGFNVTCLKAPLADSTGKPFVLAHQWAPAAALGGSAVALQMQLDLSARSDADAAGVQATVIYPAAVLRYDSSQVGAHSLLAVNGRTAGLVNFAAANTDGSGLKGKINLGKLWFTVVGSTGATARTATTITAVTTSKVTEITDETRVREATFTVGTNPAPAPNTPPTAAMSAATTGKVGRAVNFSGQTSTDADGAVVNYAWAFGDGGTATGVQVAHTYLTAGTYTVALTVTDDSGAVGTKQQPIVISEATSGTLKWNNAFGAVDNAHEVVLAVVADLTADQDDTPGPERLRTFHVDSLAWDPNVLQLVAFTFGAGQSQSIDYSRVPAGVVTFSGSTISGADAGLVDVARLRFRVVGTAGTQTTTRTFLGSVLGANGIGVIDLRSRLEIHEGTLVIP